VMLQLRLQVTLPSNSLGDRTITEHHLKLSESETRKARGKWSAITVQI
jgi:hypothetical protein